MNTAQRVGQEVEESMGTWDEFEEIIEGEQYGYHEYRTEFSGKMRYVYTFFDGSTFNHDDRLFFHLGVAA